MEPDTPKDGTPRTPRPGETDDELSEPLRSQAKDAGLIMRPLTLTPNSMYSLEATEYAQQQGKFLEFHTAAYKALWENGQDLGDPSVLGAVATSVGLNSTELLEGLESNQYSSTVIGQYEEALQYGIRGIPTFLVGNLMFTGAQPYDVFKSAMEQVMAG